MKSNRRNFIKRTSTGILGAFVSTSFTNSSAKSYNKIIGSNDRINVAIQGLGRRLPGFTKAISDKNNNIELSYLCDVMKSQRIKAAGIFSKISSHSPKLENDIRKIFDDKRVDAVYMATPDHWHAPGACMAMTSGKHVYLEKPCSHNLNEGELLVSYQKHYNKIVQMGNQQRSSLETNQIISDIHKGIIGDTYQAIAFYHNGRGKVPNQKVQSPPDGLDWELFQGPSPRRKYTFNTWDYNWHWYGWDFGTAEMGNNATHELDIARWALNVKYPKNVSVYAGKFQYKSDGWEMYDSMDARFNFSNNKIILWDGKSRNGYQKYGVGRGTFIYGSKGSVFIDRNGYKLFSLGGKLIKEISSKSKEHGIALGGGGDMSTLHSINFFNAIRGKEKLTSPINQGVISQKLTHYANISYRINKSFDIDNKTGKIKDGQAMKLWSRDYEPGWEIKKI
jgi:predicted dehydrogenase